MSQLQVQIVHYHNQPSKKKELKPSHGDSVQFQNKEHLCQLHAIVIIAWLDKQTVCTRYLFTKTGRSFDYGWEKIELRRQGHKKYSICLSALITDSTQ
jgi:hypothetical protein